MDISCRATHVTEVSTRHRQRLQQHHIVINGGAWHWPLLVWGHAQRCWTVPPPTGNICCPCNSRPCHTSPAHTCTVRLGTGSCCRTSVLQQTTTVDILLTSHRGYFIAQFILCTTLLSPNGMCGCTHICTHTRSHNAHTHVLYTCKYNNVITSMYLE